MIERMVSEGNSRVYSCFSLSPNWGGSIKAYAVGCNLMCGFCWSPCRTLHEITEFCSNRSTIADILRRVIDPHLKKSGISVDKVVDIERALGEISSTLLSPKETVQRMRSVAEARAVAGIGAFELLTEGSKPTTLKYYTITGGEPSLCRSHLLAVVETFCEQNLRENFLLQTNGFIFGSDPSYLKALTPFKDYLQVRVSLKAGTPEGLLARTGAVPKAFGLPFKAIQHLLSLGFRFHLAVMSDPKLMPRSEYDALLERIGHICESYGKKVYSMINLFDNQPEEGYVQGLSDAVLLDEEKYVALFPQILSEALNVNHAIERG